MHGLPAIPLSFAQDNGSHQGGGTGVYMDDGAAGKVKGAHLAEPASAPNPVADREIDKCCPEHGKQGKGGKLHSFGIGAGYQGRGDDGEHQLKGAEEKIRDGV